MRSTADIAGAKVVLSDSTRRIGKVLRAVFFPDGLRLAGFLVERPDLALVVRQSDRFFAFDRFEVRDNTVVVSNKAGSWDRQACARLSLDWDTALIVQGLRVLGSQGDEIGYIDSVEYNEVTGAAECYLVSSSLGAKTLIGLTRIPAAQIAGFDSQRVMLRPGFEIPDAEGGLAAKAGQQTAKATNFARQKTASAGAALEAAATRAATGVEKTGYKAGQVIGQAARNIKTGKTTGMFKSFADEYKKAANPKANKDQSDSVN